MIKVKKDGEDQVFAANARGTGDPDIEALRINGKTGKVTLSGGFASPTTLLQDTWDKLTTDAAAGTATAEHLIFRAPGPLKVQSVQFIPDAALTASDTNYATILIQRRNANGTSAVTLATITTQTTGQALGSGNWTAWVAVQLKMTAANLLLAAGQLLTIQITKTGTGVIVPWGSFAINYFPA